MPMAVRHRRLGMIRGAGAMIIAGVCIATCGCASRELVLVAGEDPILERFPSASGERTIRKEVLLPASGPDRGLRAGEAFVEVWERRAFLGWIVYRRAADGMERVGYQLAGGPFIDAPGTRPAPTGTGAATMHLSDGRELTPRPSQPRNAP